MTASGAKSLLLLGVVGIGLYYVYKAVSGATNLASTAVNAATCAVSSGIANSIINWTTCCAITTTPGINVQFPNGSQVALSALPQGHDCAGNTYVQYQGSSYQLTGSNSCGSYQATQT
jgi:hypothetical protein